MHNPSTTLLAQHHDKLWFLPESLSTHHKNPFVHYYIVPGFRGPGFGWGFGPYGMRGPMFFVWTGFLFYGECQLANSHSVTMVPSTSPTRIISRDNGWNCICGLLLLLLYPRRCRFGNEVIVVDVVSASGLHTIRMVEIYLRLTQQ